MSLRLSEYDVMEKKQAKLIHEGDYVAEVRISLRKNDIETAAKYGKVYRVSLVAG